jgi:ankyrin repeat protein
VQARELGLRLRALELQRAATKISLETADNAIRQFMRLASEPKGGLIPTVDILSRVKRFDLIKTLLNSCRIRLRTEVDKFGNSLLLRSTVRQHYELIETVLQVDACDKVVLQAPEVGMRQTPLIAAATVGNSRIVQMLLNANSSKKHLFGVNGTNQTVLMLACEKDHLEYVKMLMKARPTEEHLLLKCTGGSTALMYAAHGGHLEIIKHIRSVNPSKKPLTGEPIENNVW